MQPNRRQRRSWNWRRLVRKARAGAVAALVSLPILVFVGLIYVAGFLGRLFRRPRRRHAAPLKLIGSQSARQDHGGVELQARDRADPDPGSRQMQVPAGRRPPGNTRDEPVSSASLPQAASHEIDSAIASGLAICATPAAVLVVVEEAALRYALRWQVLEAVFSRLIDLGASSSDVRALMQVAGYEWLYEMQIAPRRFIRIKAYAGGGIRWQHYATRLICFEFEGGQERVLPPPDAHVSQSRLFFYFDGEDRLLGWDRPREPRRRYL